MYVNEVLNGHELRCKREFHMESYVFHALVKLLRDKNLLSNGLVQVEEQVAMFLYTLAKNASNRTVQERFQHSGDSDCIGAIDETHIPITIEERKQDAYRNRKQSLSQNAMVVCDFDNRFTYVMAGWEGSAYDATVLKSAIDDGFTVLQGKHYLVDAGYANTPQFLAPYRGVRYHVQEQGRAKQKPRNYKELFNYRHAKLRNHVERIIGVLKMRFPILKVATYHNIKVQTNIVHASCILHNFIVNHNGCMNWANDKRNLSIDPNEVIVVPDGDTEYGGDIELFNNQRRAGNSLREQIAIAMWNDYIRHPRKINDN